MVYIYRYIYALVLIFAVSAWAHAQDGSVQQKGIKIFVEHRCYTCHTIKAESDAIQKEKEAFAKSKGGTQTRRRKRRKRDSARPFGCRQKKGRGIIWGL